MPIIVPLNGIVAAAAGTGGALGFGETAGSAGAADSACAPGVVGTAGG
jgi:hypothetical protein